MSCPPYLLVAHILAVDESGSAPVVSYSLHDESGYALERVTHAELDDGWWQAFQPLVARYG